MIYQNRGDNFSIKMTSNNCCRAHIHRQIEVFYVLEGAIEVAISGKRRLLEKGMASIAFPNEIHETHTPENSVAVMIIFSQNFLPDFYCEFNQYSPQLPFIGKLQDEQQFSQAIQGLLENVRENTDIRIHKGYLYVIVSMLLSQMTLIKQKEVSADICQAISDYIGIHFTEELSLTRLAAELGYNKYYVSHVFQEKFGCSYNDYLKQIRSEYAMGLLAHTERTVTDICFASGFSSLRSFYRAFHEIYGVPPKAVK